MYQEKKSLRLFKTWQFLVTKRALFRFWLGICVIQLALSQWTRQQKAFLEQFCCLTVYWLKVPWMDSTENCAVKILFQNDCAQDIVSFGLIQRVRQTEIHNALLVVSSFSSYYCLMVNMNIARGVIDNKAKSSILCNNVQNVEVRQNRHCGMRFPLAPLPGLLL